ncbi:N-acetylmuramoyl-L-alanine amidase CwlD [Clostridium algidicarnis]|uniref:N-acetylmuramoyl-L-alanine amidase CwlD n=1 Tax=Clostridium algidicarnis TaxID=37659 RepID=UPI001C0B166E|nr:N-acetylmuramoyl-L-alanine amidase CwlD [Clostridium algidicarnis]
MFILTLILAITPLTYKTEALENKNKIILIDPGHGGIDGGAVSKGGTLEKDINLSISKLLKESLEKEGYEVYITRDEDKGLYEDKGTVREKKNQDLTNRCIMKDKTKCDMFLSIHLNMFPQIKYSGAQVWYSDYKESKDFARILQDTLKEELNPNNNRNEKAAGDAYKILRDGYKAPCVIIECGFLSNIEEEAKLKTSEYQESIAKAITKAVNKYYNN